MATRSGKSSPAGRAEHDQAAAGKRAPDDGGSEASWRIGRPKGTGTQRVYDHIREDILGLRLAPGMDLDESRLEQRFGVSRTPVREALIRLASEGLITMLPNRGARVTPIDISEVPQLFEALELCQRATIRWAARRRSGEHIAAMRQLNRDFLQAARDGDMERMGDANNDFHMVVARACGNRYFGGLYASLLTVSLRLARTCFAYAPQSDEPAEEYYEEIFRQHEAMTDALERRDEELADDLAKTHTDLFRNRINRYINSSLASTVELA